MRAASDQSRRGRVLAASLGALAVGEVLTAASLILYVSWSWRDALEAFVVTNSVMGFAFAVCGATIAWHRPDNPIGWLFVADGLGHATAALAPPLFEALQAGGAALGIQRAVVTLFVYSWPWSIGLFLPLTLLLFPDGHPPSRRWRPVVVGIIATAPLFVLAVGAAPERISPGMPVGYLTIPGYDGLQTLWAFAQVRTMGALLLALAGLVVRYRRATEIQRRQLLWLLFATLIVALGAALWSFVAGTPIVVLLAIPLIPAAVAVAILRHQLLDIRLVVARAFAWLLLSIVVVAGYIVLVAILDRFVSDRIGRSAVATIVMALLAAPVLPRLQRAVDRAMYGDRRDPARVASRVGERLLAGPDEGFPAVAAVIRGALRVPYVAVAAASSVLGEDGQSDGAVRSVPLGYGGETVGELVVGLRPGERDLAEADRHVLTLLTAPLAVAVHASVLSARLQTSRQHIIEAREEERRRLRRDLHDGLGPTLTGVALTADAAANLLESDVERARELLGSLSSDARNAIADVRRVVHNLRPPALDELGLIVALQQRADQLAWREDGTRLSFQIDVPDGPAPALPAAIEVAAFRVATEALTNVARHSAASSALLRVRWGTRLEVEVTDDGSPNGAWRPGVGLHAMRERVAEVSGRFEAGPTGSGGRVYASFPLEDA